MTAELRPLTEPGPVLAYSVRECAEVRFYIPPLELPDGEVLVLKDAQAILPPLRLNISTPDGGNVLALFHPKEQRWEVLEDNRVGR